VVAVARPVAVVLADHEDRGLDDEAEVAVFERRPVPVPHQEPDQALVALAHLVRPDVERNAGGIDDCEVARERAVERDESVVEDQFRRWAGAVPDGFTFAPKLALARLDRVPVFVERVAVLGDRLGPIRISVQATRDEGLLSYVLGSVDPALELAFDFQHESWA